jgi:REP element-mobilizing transposase RayT
MLNDIDFTWQPGYYDRIIRNEKELTNIQQYILDNPDNWLAKENDFENLYKP